MKAKISRGKFFRGLIRYLFQGAKMPEQLSGNVWSVDGGGIAAEMSSVSKRRGDITRPVWHCSLSLPPGEHISHETWRNIVRDFLSRMCVDQGNHQYVAIRHRDRAHDHVHIVVNRIGIDGTVWNPRFDARRAIQVCQELEREYGLIRTEGLEHKKLGSPSLSRAEIAMAERTGAKTAKMKVADAIRAAVLQRKKKMSIWEFILFMGRQGIVSVPNIARTGTMNGFAFIVEDGIHVKGSQCGGNWAALREYIMVPEREREVKELRELAKTAKNGASIDDVMNHAMKHIATEKRPEKPQKPKKPKKYRSVIEYIWAEAKEREREKQETQTFEIGGR